MWLGMQGMFVAASLYGDSPDAIGSLCFDGEGEDMISFHGTDPATAAALAEGQVDVGRGGGELGMGFYTGHYIHEAKAWAAARTKTSKQNVVRFEGPDDDVFALRLHLIPDQDTLRERERIRKTGQTRSFRFDVDMVWAPIVGSPKVMGPQYKWESLEAAALLNGQGTVKWVT